MSMFRPTAARRAEIDDEENRAFRLWMSGVQYRDIAEQLGVSLSTAHKRVQRARDSMRPHAEYDLYRARQLGELEVVRTVMMQGLLGAGGAKKGTEKWSDRVAAAGMLLQAQKREADLLGLDKVPTPAEEVLNMSDDELEAVLVEWAAEVAEAKAG